MNNNNYALINISLMVAKNEYYALTICYCSLKECTVKCKFQVIVSMDILCFISDNHNKWVAVSCRVSFQDLKCLSL